MSRLALVMPLHLSTLVAVVRFTSSNDLRVTPVGSRDHGLFGISARNPFDFVRALHLAETAA